MTLTTTLTMPMTMPMTMTMTPTLTTIERTGSLLFCPHCGTLLALPRDGEDWVVCEQCAHEEPASSYENVVITTRSDPEAFPSSLRQKRKTQTKQHEKGDQGTLVSEKCPVCGHMQAYSKEMQCGRGLDGILHVRVVQAWLAGEQLDVTLHVDADGAEEGDDAEAAECAGEEGDEGFVDGEFVRWEAG
ncbi:hypothetical protein NLJ89_g10609 [Agrocybe chaxingu]|uniref:DNA-directed RNA polymerase II subunit RPB9-like zinc ribbon domain-containing protein n=1 Tax=Agrocybe chaxingu TaxID=84603 RepID=A0A9W8JTX4_9AGAR|nr:hypothetical protein NLJ89_g10609 [Agrocybe chaxingu]